MFLPHPLRFLLRVKPLSFDFPPPPPSMDEQASVLSFKWFGFFPFRGKRKPSSFFFSWSGPFTRFRPIPDAPCDPSFCAHYTTTSVFPLSRIFPFVRNGCRPPLHRRMKAQTFCLVIFFSPAGTTVLSPVSHRAKESFLLESYPSLSCLGLQFPCGKVARVIFPHSSTGHGVFSPSF